MITTVPLSGKRDPAPSWLFSMASPKLRPTPITSPVERISGESKVAKEDYFAAASGWDISGLREDIQIHMGRSGSA